MQSTLQALANAQMVSSELSQATEGIGRTLGSLGPADLGKTVRWAFQDESVEVVNILYVTHIQGRTVVCPNTLAGRARSAPHGTSCEVDER